LFNKNLIIIPTFITEEYTKLHGKAPFTLRQKKLV